MKNNKGIKCTVNEYIVNAVFIKDGEPHAVEYTTNVRDARAVKANIARAENVKTSQVLVNFTLNKRSFTVDATFNELKSACDHAGIEISE